MSKIRFLFFVCIAVLSQRKACAQVTVSFNFTVDAGNQGLNGNIVMCNNSGGALPAGYYIDFRWPALNGFASGPTTVRLGAGECDKIRMTFEGWMLPANGTCRNISAGNSTGAYTAPLRYPAYGIDQYNDTVRVLNGGNQYIPRSYNQTSWQYSFDPQCFIPTSNMCLGEAQLREWNQPWDVRVPANRKSWALVAAHISTLFNNMVGSNVVSINYAFAQSMIEGRMGCDNGIAPPGGDNNPLSFNAGSVSGGCFQILAPGWAQIQQYYPSLTGSLTAANMIDGGNYVTAGLSKALYDMTTFTKYEKINCANPIGFFNGSADQYAAEEILAYAYHEGPNGSEPALLNIMKTQRATLINNNNLARYLEQNYSNASTQYAERMRNNLIQLENNFSIPGGHSAISSQAATNWVGGTPPNDYQWHGCYNAPFTWAEISAYIDEAARLFWTANVPLVKTNVQAVFNGINGGAAVNYSQLAPVIDAIVLNFPAYSPDEGLGELFFASACGSPAVDMSSCDKICAGQTGELWVHLMGTPPFSYTVQGPTGTLYTRTGVNVATDILKVNQPGTYKVISIQDATGQVFLNCHNASAIISAGTSCALPISLLDIRAEATSMGDVALNWNTAWEKNNQHFVVERCSDGTSFETIGRVNGAGNSSEVKHYDFLDENPVKAINYYRLRQVDFDNQESASRIVSVELGGAFQSLVIPNPNNGSFSLAFKNGGEQIDVTIFDVLGKMVYSNTSNDDRISFDGFPKGFYVAIANSNNQQTVQQIIVE